MTSALIFCIMSAQEAYTVIIRPKDKEWAPSSKERNPYDLFDGSVIFNYVFFFFFLLLLTWALSQIPPYLKGGIAALLCNVKIMDTTET